MALNINGTTGISGVDGSASAPALQGTDSNTGINFGTDTVNINTGGTTRATVDSSGKLGIGTSSPDTKLEVRDSSSTGICSRSAFTQSTDSNKALRVRNNSDTDTFNVSYKGQGYFAGDTIVGGTTAEAQQAITLAPNRHHGAGRITTNRANTTNVSIVWEMLNNGSQVGRIEHDHTSAGIVSGSDYRLKENDVAISDGITRVKQLRPIRYNWKSEPSKTLDGFFAHEVSSVVPEAVSGEKDAVDSDDNIIMQGMVTERLVPLLTAALQEAIVRIEALEAG